MDSDENGSAVSSEVQKQNLQLVRYKEHVLSVLKEVASPVLPAMLHGGTLLPLATAHRPDCAYGALVSSLEVLQSMEVPHFAEPLKLCPLPDTQFSFLFASSVPLVAIGEAFAKRLLQRHHTDSSSRKSITFTSNGHR